MIYFISDTHLGDGTGADRFRYPQELLGLLERIEAEPAAQLVLLGDFMELWASGLEAVMIRHAPVMTAIARVAARHPVTYVVGNHDCVPWYYYLGTGVVNLRVTERFTAARGALVALHGHQFDPFNRVNVNEGAIKVPWTRQLVQAVGFLGRVGGDAAGEAIADAGDVLERAAESLEQLLPSWDHQARKDLGTFLQSLKSIASRQSPGDRGYPEGERQYEEAAHGLMRQGARFVVMGHTHHPLTRQYGNRVYANTGSWVWDRYPPTYVRFQEGRLALLDARTHEPYNDA